MERIVQGRSATLTHTFYSGGVATDPSPDTATVTITRADGTALVTAAAATEAGTGKVTYTLTPTHTALLDTFKVVWTATYGGQAQTFTDWVQVAGDVLFTIPDALDALGDAAYDQQKINRARTYAETELERAIGYALVPRYSRDTLSSNTAYRRGLRLRYPYIRSIRSITVDGTAWSPTDVANVKFDGSFLYGWGWGCGYSNIIVGYEHGLETPPPGATRAALALALDDLGGVSDTGIDPRAESIVTADGTIRLRAGAGQYGAVGVNEWIVANRIPAIA